MRTHKRRVGLLAAAFAVTALATPALATPVFATTGGEARSTVASSAGTADADPEYECTASLENKISETGGHTIYRAVASCAHIDPSVQVRAVMVRVGDFDSHSDWTSGPAKNVAVETGWSGLVPSGARVEAQGVSSKRYDCNVTMGKKAIPVRIDEYNVSLTCSRIDPGVEVRGVLDRAGAGDNHTPWTTITGTTVSSDYWATYPEPRGVRIEARR